MQTLLPLQRTHAAPPTPQSSFAVPALQVSRSQQPAQLEAVQRQVPRTHRSPTPHAADPPHRQAPVAEQVSAETVEQLVQVAPLAPQVASDLTLHVVPEQQPPGHETASQLQIPARQRWPAAHGAFVPHRHAPAEQRSAVVTSHAAHAPPLTPHAAVTPIRQTPASQHPPLQDVASQTQLPPEHRSPAPHGVPDPHLHVPEAQASACCALQLAQAPPFSPHAVTEDTTQVPAEQQPAGHETESQTHSPELQRCPAPHALPAPHAQRPVAEQLSELAPHAAHASPAAPHAALEGTRQLAPEQQPPAHPALHPEQVPPAQVCGAGHAEHACPAAPQNAA